MTFKNLTKTHFEQNKLSWKNSFNEGISQDENGEYIPWMTYPAINFLRNYLNKDHDIFEYGCGASTLFFTKIVNQVVSIESNKRWLDIINDRMSDQQKDHSKITLMEDALDNYNYQNFAKNCEQKFDFIIIDSLKRFFCSKNSISALKKGGAIILDDSERKNYRKIFDFFADNNFIEQNFWGIAPGQLRVKNTTIFWQNYPPNL